MSGATLRRVHEGGRQGRAKEATDAVLAVEQRLDPLAGIRDRVRRVERGKLHRLPRPVLERLVVECEDLGFAIGALDALVESLAGLFAE